MWRGMIVALAAMLLAVSPASAHGGYIYIPIIVPVATPVVPDARTGEYAHIRKVAIVTAIGQKLILGSSGWLINHSTVDISDLKLDDVVDKTLRQYLQNRFTIVDVPYDREKLAAIPNGSLDFTTGDVRNFLAALPAQDVDAFVVVREDGEGAGAHTPGLSLNEGNGVDPRPLIVANYEVDIVDAKTFKTLGRALSRVKPRQGAQTIFVDMYVPVDLKVTPDQTPSPAQRAGLKKYFTKALMDSLIETVRSLNLGVTLPEPGARAMIPIPENLRPHVKTVAIVSAVGDVLTFDHRGAFFVHDVDVQPIADWNLDSEIETDVAAALDKNITVKTVAANRAQIAGQDFSMDDGPRAAPVDGLKPSPDIDAYILVVKTTGPAVLGDQISGLGVGHWTPVGSDQTTVFANYAIVIVDPVSLKPVRIVRGTASPARPAKEVTTVVPDITWSEKTPFSPEQTAAIHKAMGDVLSDSIPETLMRSGFTGMMPSGDLPPVPSQSASQ